MATSLSDRPAEINKFKLEHAMTMRRTRSLPQRRLGARGLGQ